jgi:serine/threonine protein kinase
MVLDGVGNASIEEAQQSHANSSIHDRYDLMQHRLGRGQFAEVRLALAHEGGSHGRNRVAVKVMAKVDAAREKRIAKEIAILHRINRMQQHPNLVRMLEIFDTDTECFIVLELLSGGSLLDLLQKRGRLPESECRTTVRQIASGLKAVHDLGIVHRDLKPENILFDADGVAK